VRDCSVPRPTSPTRCLTWPDNIRIGSVACPTFGAHASLLGAAAISEGCVILAAAGPRGPITPVGWTGLTFVTVILTATVPLLWRAAGTRRPFYALMALSGVDLILVACGTSLR
jgi:hypothetical protein